MTASPIIHIKNKSSQQETPNKKSHLSSLFWPEERDCLIDLLYHLSQYSQFSVIKNPDGLTSDFLRNDNLMRSKKEILKLYRDVTKDQSPHPENEYYCIVYEYHKKYNLQRIFNKRLTKYVLRVRKPLNVFKT